MNLVCDFLGKWEVGSTTENGRILSAVDVMRDLVRRGVDQAEFLPRTDLEIREEEVVLVDNTDGVRQEVWAYLTSSITDPVAFVNKRSGTVSRVVVFTVMGVQGAYDRFNLMFAIQCHSAEPEDVVEKLLEMTENIRSQTPSAISFPSSFSPASFATVHGKMSSVPASPASSLRGSVASSREHYRKPIPFQVPKLPERKPESLGFDKPSFVYDHSDDQVERDTILLNYCIDDIEAMCKELRESRSAAAGSPGSMMKLMEDYKATEFISIFQKFKLAFNLLGRLHPEMREPTAPELTHHLCPPLAFLVDACQDLFDEQVQREVASPFLTELAISLLQSSLTSRELTIWEACGDYWTLPRSQFEGSPVPYKPMFSDGWSPGYLVFEEAGDPRPAAIIKREASQKSRGSSSNSAVQSPRAPAPLLSDTESDYGSVGSGGYNDRGREEWRDLLISSGAAIALVTFTRPGANKREMAVMKGDYLEVLNTDRKWWKVRNKSQEIGFVPFTILRMLIHQDPKEFLRDRAPRPATPSPDRSPRRQRQERSPASPRRRRSPSLSPRRRSTRSPSPEVRRQSRRQQRSSSSPRRHRAVSPAESVVPPPPPQPETPTPTILRKPTKKTERSNSVETSYSMADELKHVLSYYKEEKHKAKLDILQTPDIYIDMRSTAREVQAWLKAKQFSPKVVKYLEGMNGRQVLGMKREDLEKAFGEHEGKRLDSQITLSRNQTKYTQGKNSELRAALESARKRTEVKRHSSKEDIPAETSKV